MNDPKGAPGGPRTRRGSKRVRRFAAARRVCHHWRGKAGVRRGGSPPLASLRVRQEAAFPPLPYPLGNPRSSIWGDSVARSYPETCVERPKTASEPFAEAAAHLCVTVVVPSLENLGAASRERGREVGFGDVRRGGGASAGVPPFSSGFPALAVRSSRVQYNGRKRRSCSPSLTYVISCRDLDLRCSACPARRRCGRWCWASCRRGCGWGRGGRRRRCRGPRWLGALW